MSLESDLRKCPKCKNKVHFGQTYGIDCNWNTQVICKRCSIYFGNVKDNTNNIDIVDLVNEWNNFAVNYDSEQLTTNNNKREKFIKTLIERSKAFKKQVSDLIKENTNLKDENKEYKEKLLKINLMR